MYRLDLRGTNAMCRVEEATGLTYPVAVSALATSPRVSFVRTFVRAVLVDPPNATPEMVGAIIDDIGGVHVIVEAAKALRGTSKPKRAKTRRRV